MMMNNCVQKICNKKFHYIEPHYIPRVKLESKQLRKTERKICSNNFQAYYSLMKISNFIS